MFEARLIQGSLLRKILDGMKDLVTQANFDCSSTGISLQAMDNSHVALVALLMRQDGFEHYRCGKLSHPQRLVLPQGIQPCMRRPHPGSRDQVGVNGEDSEMFWQRGHDYTENRR